MTIDSLIKRATPLLDSKASAESSEWAKDVEFFLQTEGKFTNDLKSGLRKVKMHGDKLNAVGNVLGELKHLQKSLVPTTAETSTAYVENAPRTIPLTVSPRKQYDVFISHASNDKLAYVDSLYEALRKLGIKIFYDTEVLSWGDNWKQTILDGVETSEFAIVVISKEFFGREWTERELNDFLHRQNENGQKIILPLLYELSFDELKTHYPELESIHAIKNTENTVESIAILLARELIKRYK